ncbi:MAG TPA: hypothetical protein VFU76_03835 [Terriglobales bacterium]|nr:hypothetical protein [Terriglobales bacterium]
MRSYFVLLGAVLLASACLAQSAKEARYQELLDNNIIHVDSIEIPPGFHAPVFQNTHDVIWIAVDGAALTFRPPEGEPLEISFHAGDVRLLRSFAVRQVVNRGSTPARSVIVQLKARGVLSPGCYCSGSVEKAVCGCGGAPALPDVWAVVVGNITLSEATFQPGEGYRHGTRRDDSLLVAVSPAVVQDSMAGADPFTMKAADVKWLPAGIHQLRNAGDAPAKLVTIEF